MKFRCPKCPTGELGLLDRGCSRCGFVITLGTGPTLIWRWLRDLVGRNTSVQCPGCGRSVSLTARRCHHCAIEFGVRSTVAASADSPKRKWRKFLKDASPESKRRIQWLHFLSSIAALWVLLGYAERHHAEDWGGKAALSVVFLAALGLLGMFFVPRAWIREAIRITPRLVKLSLILNYLAVLLLLQILIGEWWQRALILAGLIITTWVGSIVLRKIFYEEAKIWETWILQPDPPKDVDPSEPQGRKARHN